LTTPRWGRLGAAVLGAGVLALSACGGAGSTGSKPTGGSTPKVASYTTGDPSSPVTLNEVGSTLVEPYLQTMVQPLHQRYPNITLAPSGGGSGKGISSAASGLTPLGGSDAYLSPGEMQQYPDLLNIPIAISAQEVDYNLPGVSGLKLSGPVLAKIYSGQISTWDDPAIKALNPGLHLPSIKIIPVRRVDASGDTFIFTSYLSDTTPSWANGPGFGTTVTWPAVSSELTGNGNPGMVSTCAANRGCVAYIGVSVHASAAAAGLEQALLENRVGNFVRPTRQTILAAVAASARSIPSNLAKSLIDSPGPQSYPIINFEYMMVKSDQTDPNTALALRTFLTWAISPTGGATPQHLASVNFVALPDTVVPYVKAAIARIQS
jgi:phosphate transport system substrate-binding protein